MEVNTTKPPLLIISFLILILILCAITPLITTYFVIKQGDGIQMAIPASMIIFWGIGFLQLRIVLWNLAGKEVLTLEDDVIKYYADFKYFKDSHKTIEATNIDIQALDRETRKNIETARFRINNGESLIEPSIRLDVQDIERIKEKIKTRYNNG